MIKFIFFLLFSFSAFAAVELELVLPSSSVKQGEIAAGHLLVTGAEAQVPLSSLKGKNIAKTLYLLNVSPFMLKEGKLQSEVKVIFLEVPQSNALKETSGGQEIFISWNNIEVIPTEVSKSFLLGSFEIPSQKNFLPWILAAVGIILLGVLISWPIKIFKKKKQLKQKRLNLKQEMLQCQHYDEVVILWREKRKYLQEFPEIENSFKKLEETLFKYQFKPQRNEAEVQEVMKAYSQFKSNVTGVLSGV